MEIEKGHSTTRQGRDDTIGIWESSTEFADGDLINGKEFKRETGYRDEIKAAKQSRVNTHHAQNMSENARNAAGKEDELSEFMMNLSKSESSGSQSGEILLVNERKLLLHKGTLMPAKEQNSSAIEPWKRHVEVLNFEESEGLTVESDGVVMEMSNPLPLESHDDDDDDDDDDDNDEVVVEIKEEYIESDGEAEGDRYIKSVGEMRVDKNRGTGAAVHQHKSSEGMKTDKKSVANPPTAITKPAAQYKCSICKKKFQKQWKFVTHSLTHSVIARYSCPQCDQWFTNKQYMMLHIRAHMATTSNPYSSSLRRLPKDVEIKSSVWYLCRQCQKKFKTRNACLRHSANHSHAQHEMPCYICQKVFFNYFTLAQHLKTHTGFWYRCSVCGKNYTQKNSLNKHLRDKQHRMGPTGGFQCTMCGNSYTLMSTLTKHLQTHFQTQVESQLHGGSENSEFTCKVCGVKFQSRQALTAHGVVHIRDISPQKVSETWGKCPRKPNNRLVANDTYYPCNLCDRVFSTIKELGIHKTTIHKYPKPYQNQDSGEPSTKGRARKKKSSTKGWTPRRRICQRCNRRISKKYYSQHMSLHASSNECHMCPQQFTCNKDYMDHLESHMKPVKID